MEYTLRRSIACMVTIKKTHANTQRSNKDAEGHYTHYYGEHIAAQVYAHWTAWQRFVSTKSHPVWALWPVKLRPMEIRVLYVRRVHVSVVADGAIASSQAQQNGCARVVLFTGVPLCSIWGATVEIALQGWAQSGLWNKRDFRLWRRSMWCSLYGHADRRWKNNVAC